MVDTHKPGKEGTGGAHQETPWVTKKTYNWLSLFSSFHFSAVKR